MASVDGDKLALGVADSTADGDDCSVKAGVADSVIVAVLSSEASCVMVRVGDPTAVGEARAEPDADALGPCEAVIVDSAELVGSSVALGVAVAASTEALAPAEPLEVAWSEGSVGVPVAVASGVDDGSSLA